MENFVKKLRTALGMSQVKFGDAIGRSLGSVQQYERGVPFPDEVRERMMSLAAEHGLADLAIEISGKRWGVRHVLNPGEHLISESKRSKGIDSHAKAGENTPSRSVPSDWHALLEEILTSGELDAITAVQHNLVVFGRYVRARRAGKKRA